MGEITPHPAAEIRPPERLSPEHEISLFQSNESDLDDWLRKRALKNEGRHSRTYVVSVGKRVVGFYTLAIGSVQRNVTTPKLRTNAPDPVSVMILGRLAVDVHWEKRGIGSAMLRDAMLRTLQVSEIAGTAGLLVHAISPAARAFYEAYGFTASNLEPMTLMISVKEVARDLGV